MTGSPPKAAADRDFALYRRSRDPEALGRVFDATAGKLLVVAMHLVRDAAAAEDVLQATFLAAMRNCEQYDPARPVLPWLTGILTNQATICWRERSRLPDPERLAALPVPDPARIAETRESAAAVAQALDGMPSPYRQVLVLALVHDLRGIEIARALERSPETVRSQLHRGLELLRKALPRGLAVPALALAVTGTFAGRGLAAVRAAVHAQALAHATPVVAVAAKATAGLGGFAAWFAGGVFMQKAILGVIGALGAAFLLWCVWPGVEGTGGTPAASTERIDALRAPVALPAAETASAAAASAQRIAMPGAVVGPRLLVRVVDARTDRPVPAAEVMSVLDLDAASLPEPERETFATSELRDAEAHARRFGQLWRSGSDGTVAVPQPRGWHALFVARAGHHYGQAEFQRDGSPELRIPLEDDRTLRMRVLGPDGTPQADVGMALALRWSDEPQPSFVQLGVTDQDGQLSAPHLQLGIQDQQRLKQRPPVSCRVVPRIPAVTHAGVPIDLSLLPREPVVVTIPATGRIAVELDDDRGSRAGECWGASLREVRALETPQSPAESLADWFSASGDSNRHADGDGRLVFPHVGLGARFAVMPDFLPQQEGPGPARPGEVIVFHFRPDAKTPSLHGRALDSNGEPLCHQSLHLQVARSDGCDVQRVHTEGNGVFRCPLLTHGRLRPPVSCVQFELVDRVRHTGIMARVEPDPPADGQLELGDVVLREGPLLAAGTMVDTEGSFVTPVLELGAADPDQTAADPAMPPPIVCTGPADHFSIRGWLTAAKLELRATDRDCLPAEPLCFDRGATDLRLVLRRKGRIVANVLHDLPYDQALLLRTEMIADGDTEPRRPSWAAGPATEGQMRIYLDELPAGRCTLLLRIAGDPQPLATIVGLEVGPGAVQDPRLQAIDIRGRVRLAHVLLLDDAGAPVRGDGTLLVDDRAKGINYIQLHDGRFTVPVASQPVAATLRVPGFREQQVHGIDGDRTVHLEPQLELHAALAPELTLPRGVSLHAFARRPGEPVNPFEEAARRQRGPIAGSGAPATAQTGQRFTFALAKTGDVEITFVLALRERNRSVILPATPATVTVGSAREQEVAFAFRDPDLQAALRELLRD